MKEEVRGENRAEDVPCKEVSLRSSEETNNNARLEFQTSALYSGASVSPLASPKDNSAAVRVESDPQQRQEDEEIVEEQALVDEVCWADMEDEDQLLQFENLLKGINSPSSDEDEIDEEGVCKIERQNGKQRKDGDSKEIGKCCSTKDGRSRSASEAERNSRSLGRKKEMGGESDYADRLTDCTPTSLPPATRKRRNSFAIAARMVAERVKTAHSHQHQQSQPQQQHKHKHKQRQQQDQQLQLPLCGELKGEFKKLKGIP